MRRKLIALAIALLSLLLLAQAGTPWHRRRRPGLRPNHILTARVLPSDWPAEPVSPRRVDPERFARALHQICGFMPPGRRTRWAGWITQYAAEFEVDPFLLAALAYRRGRCLPDAEDTDGRGLGLTQIDRPMVAGELHRGTLRYRVRDAGRWVDRERSVDRFPFAEPRLRMAEPNLYFAAALMRMWQDQHATIDADFDQEPHRHWVSHFVWGDSVRSDWEEDQILADRRRLLEYYGARPERGTIQTHGVTLGCPLDGCPRVILSWLGAEREDGAREHRGIDIDSLPGEPVRAVADGFVYFAGVDLPGHRSHEQVRSSSGYDAYPRSELGAGGRYLCIRHDAASPGGGEEDDSPSLKSCYMHLETVEVAYGASVSRGDLIGTVGRTGMRRSAAHLHLEFHTDHLEDPSQIMAGLLIGRNPEADRPRRRRRR